MTNGNFIKLYRNILEWEWWTEPSTCKVFIYMILRANWSDRAWKGMVVRRGSFVSSVKKVAEECGLSSSQVRTALEHLKQTEEVSIESRTKFSIFTVTNYEKYQSGGVRENAADCCGKNAYQEDCDMEFDGEFCDAQVNDQIQEENNAEEFSCGESAENSSQDFLCGETGMCDAADDVPQDCGETEEMQQENPKMSYLETLKMEFRKMREAGKEWRDSKWCDAQTKTQTADTSKMQEISGFAPSETKVFCKQTANKSQTSHKQIATNKNNNNIKNIKKIYKQEKKKEKEFLPIAPEIILYFNAKAGTAFRVENEKTEALLQDRKRDGYSVDDMKKVIEKKCREWLGTKMQVNLRPEVLFSERHFEQYLNQLEVPLQQKPEQKTSNRFNNFDQRTYDPDELERLLLTTPCPASQACLAYA